MPKKSIKTESITECKECIVKSHMINQLNTEKTKLYERLNGMEEIKEPKEKKKYTPEEKEAKKKASAEKKKLKEEREQEVENLTKENKKLKAEFLRKFGVEL
jgi:RPA family protein